MWDDSEGHGLGGKQYGAGVAQCWGTACSVASTMSGYSWAIGTTCVGVYSIRQTHCGERSPESSTRDLLRVCARVPCAGRWCCCCPCRSQSTVS